MQYSQIGVNDTHFNGVNIINYLITFVDLRAIDERESSFFPPQGLVIKFHTCMYHETKSYVITIKEPETKFIVTDGARQTQYCQ